MHSESPVELSLCCLTWSAASCANTHLSDISRRLASDVPHIGASHSGDMARRERVTVLLTSGTFLSGVNVVASLCHFPACTICLQFAIFKNNSRGNKNVTGASEMNVPRTAVRLGMPMGVRILEHRLCLAYLNIKAHRQGADVIQPEPKDLPAFVKVTFPQ